jgi:CRP-like cAMP-binding protein
MDANGFQFTNRFLASLPVADFELLRPNLRYADLPQRSVLFEVGDTIDRVYFPHDGIISIVVPLSSGEHVEAAMIGRDSIVGASSILPGATSLNQVVAQITATASTLDVETFRKVAGASVAFRNMLIRHEQALFAEMQQAAACNASHRVEARLARWLLRSRDLVESDNLEFTQEYLSQILGVRRTSVSLVAGTLREAGLIKYRRGHLNLSNTEALEATACECYATIKAHRKRLLEGA